MTLRDDLLPTFQYARNLIDDLGLRVHRVIRRKVTWSGGSLRLGEPCVDDLEILPRPKIVEQGNILVVGPITPKFSGGGYDLEDLRPAAMFEQDTNVEVSYFTDGPRSGEWVITDLDLVKAFGYFFTLEPATRLRPF